jgi:ribosomal-protein-alanine N-acetyltransferase
MSKSATFRPEANKPRMQLRSDRLLLKPMSYDDFELFVRDMLTDPKVVEHYHQYQDLFDLQQIRVRAERDFWDHFEDSRDKTGLEIWSIFELDGAAHTKSFIGWVGMLHTELTDEYRSPELQFMLTSRVFDKGYATEAAKLALEDARRRKLTPKVVATVDIPNLGSIRVLEKLGFELEGQIFAYDSPDMYLYTYTFN